MKIMPMKVMPLFVVLFALTFATIGAGGDISNVAWSRANVAALRSLDKPGLVKFLNEKWPGAFTSEEIGQFEWADLAGNGQYQLMLTLSGPCAHFVAVYGRDSSGRLILLQRLAGWADLKSGIRDLNGDGKDELIIARPLVEYSCAAIATWTAVYRFENGKYVETSRAFPRFYDEQVLPRLEERIADDQSKSERGYRHLVAAAILERDKILRVLGRNPAAGLNQAYQWMNADDPYLLLDAEVTFKDIGGHQEEVRAAELAYTRADCERYPAMVKCRNLPKP